MDASNWVSWALIPPPPEILIQWIISKEGKIHTGYRSEVHPLTNVYGVYWRLTGIGREQIGTATTTSFLEEPGRISKVYEGVRQSLLRYPLEADTVRAADRLPE